MLRSDASYLGNKREGPDILTNDSPLSPVAMVHRRRERLAERFNRCVYWSCTRYRAICRCVNARACMYARTHTSTRRSQTGRTGLVLTTLVRPKLISFTDSLGFVPLRAMLGQTHEKWAAVTCNFIPGI